MGMLRKAWLTLTGFVVAWLVWVVLVGVIDGRASSLSLLGWIFLGLGIATLHYARLGNERRASASSLALG